jgi:DNA repair exonuclease SbcCD nuclease subunit
MFKEIKTYGNKFLIIGDIHFGNKNNDLNIIERQKMFFNFIKDYVIKNDIKDIILLGDVFHNRTYLKINIINEALKIIKDLSEQSNVYILCGNHDVYSKTDNSINSLTIFSNLKNVFIIDLEPVILKTKYNSFLFVPYFSIKEDEIKFYENIKNRNYDIFFENYGGIDKMILVTHTSIIENPETDDDRFCVDLDSLKRFYKVFNGDIHIRKTFMNVYNVGSLMSFDFNDSFNTKGIYLIKFEPEFSVEFIKNDYDIPYKKYKLERLKELDDKEIIEKLKNSIVRIEIDLKNKFDDVLDRIKNIKDELKNTEIIYYYYNSTDNDSNQIQISNKSGSYSSEILENFIFDYIKNKINNESKRKKILDITESCFKKIKKDC